ncbi:MAG: Nif3-like dinuclear metal center hexameric protein [Pirellulaceae bacterium]
MPKLQSICQFLDSFAPLRLAEDWDNVGLLMGDRSQSIERIMTCLTVTPESAAEAIERKADLIVSHHPIPFRSIQKITTDTVSTKLIWNLARAGVAIYSPHTAFDSAADGINARLATMLELNRIQPLRPADEQTEIGSGRYGELGSGKSVGQIVDLLKEQLNVPQVQISSSRDQVVSKVAVACGSGGSFLSTAAFRGCDCFVTGEATFHAILEARALGLAMVLVGHFASERFALEQLAERLSSEFADCEVWASTKEESPLRWA